MANKAHLGCTLALGFWFGMVGFAQTGHGGGHGGGFSSGHVGNFISIPHPGLGYHSSSVAHPGLGLGPFPNAVSSQVGVGTFNGFQGSNGFHNPHGPGYGSGPLLDPSRRNNGYNRGVGVGVYPFFPFGFGYGGYGGYDNGYTGAYDPSVDAEQPGPYQQEPYAQDPNQGYNQGGPYQPGPYQTGAYPMDSYPSGSYQPGPYGNQQPLMTAPPNTMQAYAVPPATAPDAHTTTPPEPPVTIVLRNGQQLKIQNFAVANGFFWDFSKPAPHKIPIASIDIPASAKATEDSGAEFPDLKGASAPRGATK